MWLRAGFRPSVVTPLRAALGKQRQGDLFSWRPAWSTEPVSGQPGLHRKTLSQKNKREQQQNRKEIIKKEEKKKRPHFRARGMAVAAKPDDQS